ncbi:leucine-rich repeat-containing protein 15-like [Branchiostoma lanceolatum]|uniref:leucine-rich repeat-containing protein 15-like n=1 Tax=Branchiostoma lanceolatum TaxID=7740 RepID=UPI003456D355
MSNKARRMLVLLLIILKEAGPTAACSSSCSSECDCSSRGLTSVPQDLPTDITMLTLEDNAITTLSQSDFSRYTSLTVLELSQNQISVIQNKTFNNLTSLTRLDLGANQLTNLPADIFVGLGNLQELYLQDNQLTSLSSDTFEGLGNLQTLYLYQNQITNLPTGIFVGLGNLQTLLLSINQLTSLSADIFVGLGELETLYLHHNQITNLPADIFVGLGNLQILLLYQNQLTNLPADLFVGLSYLKRLDLRWNSIHSIEAGMFNDTTKLRILDLGYNSISTIAANTYDLLASISTVDINNNPWQCDCRMAPFKQRMNSSYPFENQIICAGPGNLTGQYLRDVNPYDLICEETTAVYSTLSTKRIVYSTLSLFAVSSSSPFHQSAKSTSKAQTLSPTASNTPNADSNPGWPTVSTSPLFGPSIKSTSGPPTSSQTPQTANPSDTNTSWSKVSTDSPFGFQSTMTESNTGPTGGGIVLSVPLVATLCIFLGLFIISTIALTIWCMNKRRERDPNSVQNSSNSNPAGTSSGHDQIRQPAGINSQSETLHPSTEDSQHIYNVPTDDVDTEYNTIPEINQPESPHQGAGNMQSLDSFGYLVIPPPLPTENKAGPQAGSHSEPADAAACTGGGHDTWTDEAEYNDVISHSQRPQLASGQIQHLGSFNNGYEVPSLSLGPENGADPQEREGPQSHKYENSQVIAAAKDAAAGPQFIEYENDEGIEARKEGPQSPKYENSQVIAAAAKDAAAGSQFIEYENDEGIEARKEGPQSPKYENSQVIAAAAKDAGAVPQAIVYQNDDESIDNQSQTAAAPGADSPNHYEPLRNPSSQQQHTYT